MNRNKYAHWPLALMVAAAVADGLLTGGNLDRMLIATPAWNRVGLGAWADFTRAADLGNGAVLYPVLALGGTAMVLLSAALFALMGRSPRRASGPVFWAAAFMVSALPFSLMAAPYIQSLRRVTDDSSALLARAFAGAHLWGSGQSIFHLAAFCTELWAIASLARPPGDAQSVRG